MEKHEFIVVASGLDPEAEDFEDRFYEAGCDDATISWQKGVILLAFAREASSLRDAVVSAIEAVAAAGAKVERIEPDYLVTITDIAARSGLTKAAISLYTKGERASGFPLPAARITSESPLWDWVEVAEWLFRNQKLSFEAVTEARLLRTANKIVVESDGKQLEHLAAIEA